MDATHPFRNSLHGAQMLLYNGVIRAQRSLDDWRTRRRDDEDDDSGGDGGSGGSGDCDCGFLVEVMMVVGWW